MVREAGGVEDQLLVVGSYCHDVLFRDGREVAETLGGAASFISNVLDAFFPPSSSSSPPFQGHRHVSKVGPDFAYAVSYPSLATASAPTTLFHAHFSSDPNAAGCHGDRALRRVRACDPILPCDLPSYRFACGLAVGVAAEIPPETLARMLDICRFVFVDAQALIRTFDPVDGTVGLVPLRDTAFFRFSPSSDSSRPPPRRLPSWTSSGPGNGAASSPPRGRMDALSTGRTETSMSQLSQRSRWIPLAPGIVS